MTEPDFSPRVEGADAAISAGRRRRAHRQLGSAGAAGAFAIAAVLVATHPFSVGGRGSDSLRVAGDPPASAEATPDPGAPSAEPTATATPSPTTTDRNSGQGFGPGAGFGNPGQGDPSATPEDSASPDVPDRVSPPPTRSTVTYTNDPDCTQQPVLPTAEPVWCLRYAGDSAVARGGTARVAVDLCRLPGTGTGQWNFGDEDGVSMQITDSSGADVKWSSQDGRTVPAASWTASVEQSTCLRFTTSWDTRDRDGFRVRPGDYYVDYSISGGPGSGSYTSSNQALLTVKS